MFYGLNKIADQTAIGGASYAKRFGQEPITTAHIFLNVMLMGGPVSQLLLDDAGIRLGDAAIAVREFEMPRFDGRKALRDRYTPGAIHAIELAAKQAAELHLEDGATNKELLQGLLMEPDEEMERLLRKLEQDVDDLLQLVAHDLVETH